MTVTFSIIHSQAALIGGNDGFYYNFYSDNKATLEEYHGSNQNLIIPDIVYSHTVDTIATSTFSNNSIIKAVVIPETVEIIGAYAFYGCTNLESVIIPSSVTAIKAATFYGCGNLTEVIIPASVTQIAANAFNECENLTIIGESGSYAETYAQEHGINFVITSVSPESPKKITIFGDVDGDERITSADSLFVLRMSVGLEAYTDETIVMVDTDDDNRITSADALELLRYRVGLSANERIGKPIE